MFSTLLIICETLHWRHNGRDSVSHHQPYDCLLNRLFRRRSKKTSKLRVTGLCVGNSPGTGEFPAQMASNAENVSIWWHHHVFVGSSPWRRLPMKTRSTLLALREGIHRSRWIPLTKASDAEIWCFLWSAPEQTAKQTIETLVIWDATVLIIKSL